MVSLTFHTYSTERRDKNHWNGKKRQRLLRNWDRSSKSSIAFSWRLQRHERGPGDKAQKRAAQCRHGIHLVKNTLLRIASKGTKAEALYDKFDGPNAIICTNGDPIGPAKVIAGLPKRFPT